MNQHDRYDFDIDRYQFIEDGDEIILVLGRMKQSIPKESLAPFIEDLTLDYSDMELSGYPHVDAIIQGNAKFLGKGFDGMVFQSLAMLSKSVQLFHSILLNSCIEPHNKRLSILEKRLTFSKNCMGK